MKVFLIALGGIVALVAAVIAYGGYANYAAERDARGFCAAIPVGSEVQAAVARAADQRIRHREGVTDGKGAHEFVFQGWVFNAGVCRVAVANGKVLSVVALMEGD